MRASQKLLSSAIVEFDDVCAIDPLPPAAKQPREPALDFDREPALDDTVEIELTADQMDALLSGR